MNPLSTPYSVALCTFNGAEYLSEQLTSILEQTVPPAEIVVCDDGSTDNTNDLVRSFMARFTEIRWKHTVNTTNIGVVKNFEKAIGLCREEIIFLSDQDDVWLPYKAAKVLQHFATHTFSIVFSDARIVDAQLNYMNLNMFEKVGLTNHYLKRFHSNHFGMYLLLAGFYVTGASMAFRKQVVQKLLPVPESPWFLHDGWIATAGACMNEISFINEPLILYRQHSRQAIGAFKGIAERVAFRKKSGKLSLLFGLLRNKPIMESIVLEFFERNKELIPPVNLQILRERHAVYQYLLAEPEPSRGLLFRVR